MDLAAARPVLVPSGAELAALDIAVVDAHEPSEEQAVNDTFAIVEVVSPLTGTAICSIHSKDVPELKGHIEEATGVRPLDQCLVLGSSVLAENFPIEQAAGREPVVVGLLRRPPVVSLVERAIGQLEGHDGSLEMTDFVKALDKELAGLHVQEGGDIAPAASLLLERALLEPSHTEGCAAIAGTMSNRYGRKFSREFLNVCQAEFEKSVVREKAEREQAKTRTFAMAAFIGYLFIWQVIPMRVVERVTRDLIGSADKAEQNPEEHLVDSACELLDIAGWDLDHTPKGKALMTDAVSHLSSLVASSCSVSGETVYSEILKDRVHMLVELRSNNWI